MGEYDSYQLDLLAISPNLSVLAEAIDLDVLTPELVERGVFTMHELQTLMVPQTESLLCRLKTKHFALQSRFLQCLIETRQYTAAHILCPEFAPPADQPTSSEIPSHPQTVAYAEPQTNSSAKQSHIDILPSTTEKLGEEKRTYKPTKLGTIFSKLPFINGLLCEHAVVKASDKCKKDFYAMDYNRMGHALVIVNNTANIKDSKDKLPGAAADCDNLKKLFSFLGYIVHIAMNKTCEEMKKLVDDFSKLNHSNMSSCIVAISCHGDEEYLLGINKKGWCRYELISKFSDENCPDLAGKPKIFFLDCCRGEKEEKLDFTERWPTYNDMWIFSAVRKDYCAYDGWDGQGSIFTYAFTKVFKSHASEKTLSELWKMVKEKLRHNERSERRQTPELNCVSAKDLRFFPTNKKDARVRRAPSGITSELCFQ